MTDTYHHFKTNQNTQSPKCRASEMLYETITISFNAFLPAPMLLATRILRWLTFVFVSTKFKAKERLLIYLKSLRGPPLPTCSQTPVAHRFAAQNWFYASLIKSGLDPQTKQLFNMAWHMASSSAILLITLILLWQLHRKLCTCKQFFYRCRVIRTFIGDICSVYFHNVEET